MMDKKAVSHGISSGRYVKRRRHRAEALPRGKPSNKKRNQNKQRHYLPYTHFQHTVRVA
jgi:hypothetical protein